MKQLFQKIGILAAMLTMFLQANAYDFEVDGIYYSMVSMTALTCQVVEGEDTYAGEIVIPEKVSYKGKEITVTSIGTVFQGSKVTSVKIPNSITSIGSEAFSGCSSMTQIELPNSIKSIGNNAFYNCSSLKKIELPNSITSIGSGAFRGCSSMTQIELPNSIKSIGYDAFYNCSSLKKIELPNSITSIESETFRGCSSMAQIELPNSIKSIGYNAFYNCSLLKKIELPNSVTSIGWKAFKGCSSLTQIELSNSLTSINSYAFEDCRSLKKIELPNSVTYIGEGAFYNCWNLESIRLNDSLENLSENTFNNCKALNSIYIPGSVETICQYRYYYTQDNYYFLFGGCENLKTVEISYSNNTIHVNYYYMTDRSSTTEYKLTNLKFPVPIENLTIDREIEPGISEISSLKNYTMGEHIKSNQLPLKGSPDLETITCYASVPPTLGELTNLQYMNVKVRVPMESLKDYQEAEGWKNFWDMEGFEASSGIKKVKTDNNITEVSRFNINGQPVGEDYRGIVIIKYSDGSVRKVNRIR